MALSDQLAKLAARAKQAEDRAAAAQQKARTDLESDVSAARASADAQGEKLRETAESGKEKVSGRWNELQQSWNAHIAGIRADIDARQERHDRAQAERDAEFAEDDGRTRSTTPTRPSRRRTTQSPRPSSRGWTPTHSRRVRRHDQRTSPLSTAHVAPSARRPPTRTPSTRSTGSPTMRFRSNETRSSAPACATWRTSSAA
jgi:hypothetical protein